MKRVLLLVAICLAGLQACDNTGQEQLTPIETEILEIEGLIASQAETGFDEQALLSDLKSGTVIKTALFNYKNGEFVISSFDYDDPSRGWKGVNWHCNILFLEDGNCRECKQSIMPNQHDFYNNYDWRYNPQTKSIDTKFCWVDWDHEEFSFSAKVFYYDKKSGNLILGGNLCNCLSAVYGGGEPVADYSLMTFHIDLNTATREECMTKYSDKLD